VGRQIRRVRQAKGITESELAKLLKSHQSNINRIENGKQGYTIDFFLRISNALNVPPHELISAESLVPKTEADKEPAIIEVFPDEASKIEFGKFRSRDDFIAIRVLEGAASLGHGSVVAQERTRGYALIYKPSLPKKAEKQKRDQEKVVCLFVSGDSMTPTIKDKSLVAIDVEDKNEIANYKIYAVEIPDEGVTIKRVVKDKDNLILMADNMYAKGFPRALNLKGLDYNPVCGKVVWTWNRLD
jgi:transcriptional regulator with XRE-family HTH domain